MPTATTTELLAMREHVRLMLAQIDDELVKRNNRNTSRRDRDLAEYRPHR